MKEKVVLFLLGLFAVASMYPAHAQYSDGVQETPSQDVRGKGEKSSAPKKESKFLSRLTVGGYGEAVMTYNFYSDNVYRYRFADRYKNSKGHGRFDLPHVVVFLGYDFGKGWSMQSEIEFEHGGVEAAVEMEDEEAGEFEKEIERGGEVALEQFYIQKSFMPQLNLRAGHLVVPVGLTNAHHLPTEFFTVYRPEGENTIIPCTWHETGISLWGRAGAWRYEAMFLSGLNSNFFSTSGWVHDGSASPYEFKPANKFAGAFRIDNYSVKGLRLGLSGYIGDSFNNDILTDENSSRYSSVKGTVMIGAFDFEYNDHGFVARGNFDYGHLNDAGLISTYNLNSNNSTSSPYSHTSVGKAAMSGGAEFGFDFFSLNNKLKDQKFYVFGRYEYYDSYIPYSGAITDYTWTDRHRVAVGINYFPMKEIVIKAEYSHRFLKAAYNNEPSISLGIAYSGFFKH